MSDRPTISAVIPAYNNAAYLPDAVASVRAQSVPVREIIVVDDGSTDNTAAVVATLGADIRYLRQINAGPSAARNAGIAAAQGEFIAFLDADDQWTPDKTAQQLAVFEKHPELVLIAADMAETDIDGRTILVPSVLDKHKLRDGFRTLEGRPLPNALSAVLRKNFIPTGTVLVRRDVFDQVGMFNTNIRYGEDLEMWSRIAANFPITCLPEVHMLRRQHGMNATQATAAMLEVILKVMVEVRKNVGDELRKQGVRANDLVANALAELAYLHFCTGDLARARGGFLSSFQEQRALKPLIYWAACHLPLTCIKRLRVLKQKSG
jgi:glycosyltransferase involved in cell wall biosynthesis